MASPHCPLRRLPRAFSACFYLSCKIHTQRLPTRPRLSVPLRGIGQGGTFLFARPQWSTLPWMLSVSPWPRSPDLCLSGSGVVRGMAGVVLGAPSTLLQQAQQSQVPKSKPPPGRATPSPSSLPSRVSEVPHSQAQCRVWPRSCHQAWAWPLSYVGAVGSTGPRIPGCQGRARPGVLSPDPPSLAGLGGLREALCPGS